MMIDQQLMTIELILDSYQLMTININFHQLLHYKH